MKLGIVLLVIGIAVLIVSIPLSILGIVAGVIQLTQGNLSGEGLTYAAIVGVIAGFLMTGIGAVRVFKR